MSRIIDPMLHGGVTRNPFHPKAKDIFANNFDTLKFKVDGEEIDTALVMGAYPHLKVIAVFVKDEDGSLVMNDEGRPIAEAVTGKVEIEGTASMCNCGMGKFRVSSWWEKPLNG